MSAVGVQKRAGNINDFFLSPYEDKSGFLCHNSHGNCFQIFLVCIFQESIHIFWIHNHSHTLLRFGDGDLCAVQTRVFLGNLIQIHAKASRQFADGNGNAACSEVVTFLDDMADFLSAEHSLDLSLSGRVTFLHFRAADFDGRLCMHLGGTCRAADPVAAGASAQKDDDISRIGILTDYRASGSCAQNCADLHTLRHIIRMINFFYITGGKTDLVSIGAVPVGRSSYQLLLGKFAL